MKININQFQYIEKELKFCKTYIIHKCPLKLEYYIIKKQRNYYYSKIADANDLENVTNIFYGCELKNVLFKLQTYLNLNSYFEIKENMEKEKIKKLELKLKSLEMSR